MEAKQKSIQEAYGEHWEAVKDFVDDNGWIDFLEDTKRIRDFFHNSDNIEVFISMWRPKSLQGIENNNGWIKIESEADLPKYSEWYWVIKNDGQEILSGYEIEKSNKRWMEQITHYQPIQKPKQPIY